jgi:hypothetical protein
VPTIIQESAVFDGTAGQGLFQPETFLPPDTEAYRVVLFRVSLLEPGFAVAAADIASRLYWRYLAPPFPGPLFFPFAPVITTGGVIAWDFPCDTICPRKTEVVCEVDGGNPQPSPIRLTWDFQITAPTRG